MRIRGDSGKFPNTCISLSVKSMASCGYSSMSSQRKVANRIPRVCCEVLTPATPRFSMAGILCPVVPKIRYQLSSPQSVVSCSFQKYAPRRSNSRSFSGLR